MQAFGIGAVAAPRVAEEEIKKLTSLRGHEMPPLHYANEGVGVALNSAMHPVGMAPDAVQAKALAYIRAFGVPEHLKDMVRDDTRWVMHLDVDIATKRSWSLSYKILQQRQRNYENELKRRTGANDWRHRAVGKFLDATGFHWPW